MVAYLKFLVNPKEGDAFERLFNTPRRGLGAKSWSRFQSFVKDNNYDLLEALERVDLISGIRQKEMKGLKELALNLNQWRLLLDTNTTPNVLLEDIIEKTKWRKKFDESEAECVKQFLEEIDTMQSDTEEEEEANEEVKEGEEAEEAKANEEVKEEEAEEREEKAEEKMDEESLTCRMRIMKVLDRIALQTSDEEPTEETKNRVTLSTIHQSKVYSTPTNCSIFTNKY